MEINSYNESDFIFDEYNHSKEELFYSVTRTQGKGVPEEQFQQIRLGCNCFDSRCTVENNCSCLKYGANYILHEERLILAPDKYKKNVPVFECNSQCRCFSSVEKLREKFQEGEMGKSFKKISGVCPNRNVQFGPIECLEIFEAGAKGFGLRTKEKIISGSFICEYAGEVISLEEAEKRLESNGEMNYVFVLREFSGRELSSVTCVDPSLVGNIGRYINHSCEPNSAVIPIRVNDTIPWLCVFAIKDIEENEEICYDYSGYGNVAKEEKKREKKLKKTICFCQSVNCKKFLPFHDI